MTKQQHVMTAAAAEKYAVAATLSAFWGLECPPLPNDITHLPSRAVIAGFESAVDTLEDDLSRLPERVTDDPLTRAALQGSMNDLLARIRAEAVHSIERFRAQHG